MASNDLVKQLMVHTRTAIEVLEKNGYTFIYADEDEKERRKELRSQGITRRIRVVPWKRNKHNG